jgi:hypothetical protein
MGLRCGTKMCTPRAPAQHTEAALPGMSPSLPQIAGEAMTQRGWPFLHPGRRRTAHVPQVGHSLVCRRHHPGIHGTGVCGHRHCATGLQQPAHDGPDKRQRQLCVCISSSLKWRGVSGSGALEVSVPVVGRSVYGTASGDAASSTLGADGAECASCNGRAPAASIPYYVLLDMQDEVFGPHSASISRILISVMYMPVRIGRLAWLSVCLSAAGVCLADDGPRSSRLE